MFQPMPMERVEVFSLKLILEVELAPLKQGYINWGRLALVLFSHFFTRLDPPVYRRASIGNITLPRNDSRPWPPIIM